MDQRRIFRVAGPIAAALLLIATLTPAEAAKGGPTDTIKGVLGRVAMVLKKPAEPGTLKDRKRDKKLTKLINKLFDYEILAKEALGPTWNGLTKKERSDYVTVLTGVIENSYVAGLKGNDSYDVKWLSETITGPRAVVKTEVTSTSKKRPKPMTVSIDYRLKMVGRSWKVIDVITDDDSLVALYRAEFGKVMASSGFIGLMAKLRERLAAGPVKPPVGGGGGGAGAPSAAPSGTSVR